MSLACDIERPGRPGAAGRWILRMTTNSSSARRAAWQWRHRCSAVYTADDLDDSAEELVPGSSMDLDRIRRAVREILLAVGEDPDREGLRETPDRVARMYAEVFQGLPRTRAFTSESFSRKSTTRWS